jgi:FG-GAP repeat protein
VRFHIPNSGIRVQRTAFVVALILTATLTPQLAEAQRRNIISRSVFAFPSGFTLHVSGVLGDFDGDHRADLAVAQPQGLINGSYRYRIELFFAGRQGSGFDLESGPPGGLHMNARDVDGDHNLDLVVTAEFGRELVGVWINDGHGQFTKALAETYAQSVWPEGDRDFSAPGPKTRSAAALAASTGGWTIESARSSEPLLCRKNLLLPVAADGPALVAWNAGNPFRAPPLVNLP